MRRRGTLIFLLVMVARVVLSPPTAFAQAPDRSSPVIDIVKKVASDPTTYAPALISAEAQYLDWRSSQVFFQHGFLERNPAFTISGRPDDVPLGYGAGNKQIVNAGLRTLGSSLVHNVAVAIIERELLERYPKHPKLVRALAWTERTAYASWLSYRQSATYFRQWRRNVELQQQLGF